MKKPSVSIFFPCYNDENTIGTLVVQANRVARKISNNFEIIVINDGSHDNSLKVLKEVKKKIRSLKIINHIKNKGYGGALKSGFSHAKKELVFYTDGDGQYDLAELPLLLSCLTPDVDVVNGIKIDRADNNVRVFLGHAYRSLIRNLFNTPVYDIDCDFRLIRRKFLDGLKLNSKSGGVCVELVTKLDKKGARFREVSVHHYPRRFGRSQFFKVKPLLLTLWDLLNNFD